MKRRIFIKASQEGSKVEVVYLHSDKVAGAIKGPKVAPRVSNVVYDPVMNEWVATLLDGKRIGAHKERDKAIAIEVETIDRMFAEGEWIPGGFHQPFRIPIPSWMKLPEGLRFAGAYDLVLPVNKIKSDIYIQDAQGHEQAACVILKDDGDAMALLWDGKTKTYQQKLLDVCGTRVHPLEPLIIGEMIHRIQTEKHIKQNAD